MRAVGLLIALMLSTAAYAASETITYDEILARASHGDAVSIECAGDCRSALTLVTDEGSRFDHATIEGIGYTLTSIGSERPLALATIVFTRDAAAPPAEGAASTKEKQLPGWYFLGVASVIAVAVSYALGTLARERHWPEWRAVAPAPPQNTPQQLATRMARTADASDAMLRAATNRFNAVVAHIERSLEEIRHER